MRTILIWAAGILAAVELHGLVLCFGGLLIPSANPSLCTTQHVELHSDEDAEADNTDEKKDPQTKHQQMRITIEHPQHGPLDVLGFPIKFSDDPCRVHRPPPVLGADTDALLAELGRDASTIASLRERGIV